MARDSIIQNFLDKNNYKGFAISPLREDASARKYYRAKKDGTSYVVMDAPPPFEEISEFVRKAEIFKSLGLRTPRIFASDAAHGLLLLEDFGDQSYGDLRKAGHDQKALYKDAVDVLIHAHKQPVKLTHHLPPLSDVRLTYLVSWIIEWYIPLVQPQTLSRVIRERFFELWSDAYQTWRKVPQHAVHLDYQFHNLMRLPGNSAAERCGILDFQDACYGPVTSDLVLLLQDAREDVPADIAKAGIDQYLAAFPEISRADFEAAYAINAAHNASRIVGLFARLKMRDKKPQYLGHIPRNLRYLEESLRHPALAPIKEWFDTYVPEHLRLNIPELKAA